MEDWTGVTIQFEAASIKLSKKDLLPAEIQAFQDAGYAVTEQPMLVPLLDAADLLGHRINDFGMVYDKKAERRILTDCLLPAPDYLLYIEKVDEGHSAWGVHNDLGEFLDRPYPVMDEIIDYDGKRLMLNESSESYPDGVKVLILGLTAEEAEMIKAQGLDAVYALIHDALQENLPAAPLS